MAYAFIHLAPSLFKCWDSLLGTVKVDGAVAVIATGTVLDLKNGGKSNYGLLTLFTMQPVKGKGFTDHTG